MLEQFLFSINLLINVFGVLACFYILMNNSLNTKEAICVIPVCLLGFMWFSLFYSGLLHVYHITFLEVIYKSLLLFMTCLWIKNNYKIDLGERKYVRF